MKRIIVFRRLTRCRVVLVLLALVMVLGLPLSEGASWVKVGAFGSDPAYLDRESIERGPDNAVRAWIRCRVARYVLIGDKFLDMFLIHYEFNCKEKKSRNLETLFVYKDGTSDRVQTPGFWKDVTINNSEIHRFVCP